MKDVGELRRVLRRIDGRGYKAYREIEGAWRFAEWVLFMDHVQGDPFAAPSRVRVEVPARVAGLPPESCANRSRALGVAALLAGRFAKEAAERERRRGSGGGGAIRMEAPGQEVLEQTAVMVAPDGGVEARFTVGLPARGRQVLGLEAAELLIEDVPAVVERSLYARAYRPEEIRLHWQTNEDADVLRGALRARGLVAFVADGAVLPRRSGVDERPLAGPQVVPFESPPSLRVTLEAPNAGPLTGMGIPRGVTLIVGGGYHGKSTLLKAIERGVYNHRPGDGRERVVSDEGLVKVRAEDGRSVVGVDISPFIGRLPAAVDTRAFTTENASGSTSQAAAIMEALEAGATGLLVDEDTAATNFMIRDRRMQALVPKESEPITPFIDRVRQLYEEHGVSSILVLGGSGDYLDVADTVIAMEAYRPQDVTARAREIVRAYPTGRAREASERLGGRPARIPLPESVDPSRGRRDVSVKVREVDTIAFGTETLDLSAVEQIVCWAQTRALSQALVFAKLRFMNGRRTLPEILDLVMDAVARGGLDVLQPHRAGDLAAFRRYELAAALNRLRTLRVAAHERGGTGERGR